MIAVPVHLSAGLLRQVERAVSILSYSVYGLLFSAGELVSLAASNRPRSFFLGPATAGGVSPGAVAQLGERLICIQEVAGSIPTSSTTLSCYGLPANAAFGRASGVFLPGL